MPGDPLRVGRIELVPLIDGDASLHDPLEGSFPGVPSEAWDGLKRQQPLLVGTGGAWRLRVRCTLIRTADRAILVDTGVGSRTAPASSWFPEPGRLVEELRDAGLAPGDVDTVVITHVHDDHLGGAAEEGSPTFPNARYVLQRADLDAQRAWAGDDEKERVVYETSLRPLEVAGVIDAVEGDAVIADGTAVRLAPGHTPGHQIVEVASDGARIVVSGDAFHLPIQLSEPDWHSGSDRDPVLASATRRSLAAELAGSGTLIAPSHFAEPFGRVASGPGGRPVWEPLTP